MKNYGLVLAYAFVVHVVVSVDPEVETSNGKIKGYEQMSYETLLNISSGVKK
jgi:hypothetical protein